MPDLGGHHFTRQNEFNLDTPTSVHRYSRAAGQLSKSCTSHKSCQQMINFKSSCPTQDGVSSVNPVTRPT